MKSFLQARRIIEWTTNFEWDFIVNEFIGPGKTSETSGYGLL